MKVIKGIKNFRDLGGLKTDDGKQIVHGKLFRCAKLYKLSSHAQEQLTSMGVTTVIDLRIDTEKREHPDTMIENIEYVEQPLLCTATPNITCEKSMFRTMSIEGKRIKKEFGSADNYMIETYRNMVFNEESKKVLKEFLRRVINAKNAILWHCASGKDRAGVCSMLVEGLLGVREDEIIKDYLISQREWRKRYFLNRVAITLVPARFSIKRILFGFMRTKKEYIATVIQDIKEKYGNIEAFCRDELGITQEDVVTMRKKYIADK